MPDVLTLFALIGIVLTVSALASAVVERAPVSFPMLFLGLGLLLGENGVGLLRITAHDPTLEAIAVISLAFVLFLDALKLRPGELRRGWALPALVLGPGTLIVVSLIALAAWALIRLPPVHAVLLGAILASTDPVVLRDVVRDRRIPRSVRQVLSLEAGTNDLVVLPLVLLLIAVARGTMQGAADWAAFAAQAFVLGPAIGAAIGGVGAWLMARIDARLGVRREHQALYGVGLVLVAYASATAVGGDGFLAAFAAGAAIVFLDLELCDCFLEYGETTAEMAMLLAFVLFGAVLSTLLPTLVLAPALLLALVAVLVARPIAIAAVLKRARLSLAARAFIGWFGPRGLSSLLLALLAVQHHVPGAERLLAITGLVVLVSVVLHGASVAPLAAWYGRRVASEQLPEERESTAAGILAESMEDVPRIAPAELATRLSGPAPPLVLDVRGRSAYPGDGAIIPGSVHVLPDAIAEWAEGQPREREVVAYCT